MQEIKEFKIDEINDSVLSSIAECDSDEEIMISIAQDIALDRNELEKLCALHKNIKFNVFYAENANTGFLQSRTKTRNRHHTRNAAELATNTYLFNEEESKIFVDNCNYIKAKYGCEFTLNYDFTVEQAVNASNRVNAWARQINTAEVNGQKLTPYEKFLWAYQITNLFVYKLSANDTGNNRESRDILSVLNSDTIVCAGYAELLSELCHKIGISCHSRIVGQHAICTVDIVDPKYNMDGIYISNPTRSNMMPPPKRLSDIDLSNSLWTYEQGSKWIRETRSLEGDYFYDFYGKEKELLGVDKETFINQKYREMEAIVKQIMDSLPKSNSSTFKDVELSDVKYHVEGYVFKGKISNLIFKIKDLLSEGVSYDNCMRRIQQALDGIDFNNPNVLVDKKLEYISGRKQKATLPTPKGVLGAYKTILMAQGILKKDHIDDEILNVLDESSYDANYGSMFIRDIRKGSSEIEDEYISSL